MISHVSFLGICVSDQDRALQFYTEQLGLKVKGDTPFEGGQRWIEVEIPGAQTTLVLFTPKGQEDRIGGFVHTSLACENLDQTYEEYKGRGVEFTTPPTKQFWGSFAMFKDPDGNTFVLSQRAAA